MNWWLWAHLVRHYLRWPWLQQKGAPMNFCAPTFEEYIWPKKLQPMVFGAMWLKGIFRSFAVPTWRMGPPLRISGKLRGLLPPFITRPTRSLGDLLTMAINHLLNVMILQVEYFIPQKEAASNHLFSVMISYHHSRGENERSITRRWTTPKRAPPEWEVNGQLTSKTDIYIYIHTHT